MITSSLLSNALLYTRAHLCHSLTSAVELAAKTRKDSHCAFAGKLLNIKMAAPDVHLNKSTQSKGHLNYRRHTDLPTLREQKYQSLAQQLERVYTLKNFSTRFPHRCNQEK